MLAFKLKYASIEAGNPPKKKLAPPLEMRIHFPNTEYILQISHMLRPLVSLSALRLLLIKSDRTSSRGSRHSPTVFLIIIAVYCFQSISRACYSLHDFLTIKYDLLPYKYTGIPNILPHRACGQEEDDRKRD